MNQFVPAMTLSPRVLCACNPRLLLALGVLVSLGVLGGCSTSHVLRTPDVSEAARAGLPSGDPKPANYVPPHVSEELAEPPAPAVKPVPEPRIDLLVNNAPARDVFLAMVADTRYSMLMHPDVAGTLSVTLRGVTVPEALESIRDVYGYDFKMDGRRITVYAPTMQTRIFTINYPNSQRAGLSELRVTSTAQMENSATTGGNTNSANGGANGGGNSAANGGGGGAGSGIAVSADQSQSSKVSTSSKTDFWSELAAAVKSIVGNQAGSSVIASPQAGIVAVRAMPDQLREVEKFLKAAQIAVERQVMLEAKLVEVELSDGFQSGVNWGAFLPGPSGTVATGVVGSSTGATPINYALTPTALPGTVAAPNMAAGGGLFGLALQTSNFAAVLGFLETQGDVQTLSSPRVATLNNQKAVLKVGTDAFYVTNVSGGTAGTVSAGVTTGATMPTVNLGSFFSGISLDVTPQIDDGENVTLHIHPAVTTVTEVSKQIDLGSAGSYRLPLASSAVNETDTMVRIQDGRIVAVGGLMQMSSMRAVSGVPGTTGSSFAALFGNKMSTASKREVIVLIKPTIIRGAADWEEQTRKARVALEDMDTSRARVIQIDGDAAK